MLLNIQTPDANWMPRESLEDNGSSAVTPQMLKASNGSKLTVKYADGDRRFIRFQEWLTEDALARRLPELRERWTKIATH